MPEPDAYRSLAEASWQWVLTQVRRDGDDLWLPENPAQSEPGDYPFGMHSGIGGLAHVIAEIRLSRDLTPDEQALAEGIAATSVRRIPELTEYDYFDGLVSTIGVLTALGAPGAELAVARLHELATPDGWQPSWLDPDRTLPEARCNDATLGTAGVLLGALWAARDAVPGAVELADLASMMLLAERVETAAGLDWDFIPRRFQREPGAQMPNWSHGLAGIAGSLAAAGVALHRPGLAEAARLGAEHLVTLGDTEDGGLRLPHVIPGQDGLDTFTYGWCHGPAGTSLLFAALDHAGADEVAGRSAYEWERACLHSLRVSGIPERRYPGFWDNDGRCCGTAGVGDVVLDVWQRHGHDDDLALAITLADAIVDRAVHDDGLAYWRFVEHRNDDPLLPPGVGWMQGAAGIAAYLFRVARVLEQGRDADAVARMDTWWATA
ncbi:lanthionine synthetase LanC family protein [Marmoricola sp. RAF53]|uniref:lanthionine synthetase LanC family protein n=1 Tax=Marmoricola sp. RAF53 TaxID=3233059 RepID=UPI003F9E0CDA